MIKRHSQVVFSQLSCNETFPNLFPTAILPMGGRSEGSDRTNNKHIGLWCTHIHLPNGKRLDRVRVLAFLVLRSNNSTLGTCTSASHFREEFLEK